ncbi:MAG TPA: hypothetical protein VEI97_10885 [bacterium]|nr:hypothetical protein [bacterium]
MRPQFPCLLALGLLVLTCGCADPAATSPTPRTPAARGVPFVPGVPHTGPYLDVTETLEAAGGLSVTANPRGTVQVVVANTLSAPLAQTYIIIKDNPPTKALNPVWTASADGVAYNYWRVHPSTVDPGDRGRAMLRFNDAVDPATLEVRVVAVVDNPTAGH